MVFRRRKNKIFALRIRSELPESAALPIILGGDDITFVCDGKLGICFSKLFIEAFEKQSVSFGRELTACAGIAMIRILISVTASYP
ncbi:hypothetical protein [Desulfonema magnum]|uniref:hypothetical protein n=1 Tax=Desulfonema magnum TaxID=45655 RepID=UPI001A9C0E37|nr:hypothetical protein [Desulfonema magnum]